MKNGDPISDLRKKQVLGLRKQLEKLKEEELSQKKTWVEFHLKLRS
tara:strand:- start:373 stop:510 length:138 start_codon:yes stop_codon:yes gene_type:complete